MAVKTEEIVAKPAPGVRRSIIRSKNPSIAKPEKAPIPAEYARSGIIAGARQTSGREVYIDRRDLVYQIGGFHPGRPDFHPPALDHRHGKVMLGITSLWDRYSETRAIFFSMRELCMRCAALNGGRYYDQFATILNDLTQIHIRVSRVRVVEGKQILETISTYRVLEEVFWTEKAIRRRHDRRILDRQIEMWLSGAMMSAEFHELLCRSDEIQTIRLDVLREIRSPLAQAVYWFIPAAASHHPEGTEPYQIGLSTLCKKVDYPVPQCLAHRLRLLEGVPGKITSLVADLRGRKTNSGSTLLVDFALHEKTKDYMLYFWVRPRSPSVLLMANLGVMKQAFLDSGYTETQLAQRLKFKPNLTNHQIGLLQDARVVLDDSEDAFETAFGLLRECSFNSTISEVKQAVQQGWLIDGRPIENPTAYAISCCVNKIRQSGPRPASDPPALPRQKPRTKQAHPVKAHPAGVDAWEKTKAEFNILPAAERDRFLTLAAEQANEFDLSRLSGEAAEEHRYGLAVHMFELARSSVGAS